MDTFDDFSSSELYDILLPYTGKFIECDNVVLIPGISFTSEKLQIDEIILQTCDRADTRRITIAKEYITYYPDKKDMGDIVRPIREHIIGIDYFD